MGEILIQLIVVVLLVVAFSCTLQWKLRKPASTAHTPIKKGYIMLALVIVVLLLSGRLNWVVPLVGGLLAGVFRLFPYLLRYSPFL